MNSAKIKAAGALGIVSGIIILTIGIIGFRNNVTRTFWDIAFIILGAMDIYINGSLFLETSNNSKD